MVHLLNVVNTIKKNVKYNTVQYYTNLYLLFTLFVFLATQLGLNGKTLEKKLEACYGLY